MSSITYCSFLLRRIYICVEKLSAELMLFPLLIAHRSLLITIGNVHETLRAYNRGLNSAFFKR
jgi:hypothetical protein